MTTLFYANSNLPTDIAAIILRPPDRRTRYRAEGCYLTLTRAELAEDASRMCGLRADAIILLDPTLQADEEWKATVLKPLLAANCVVGRRTGPRSAEPTDEREGLSA